MAKPDGERGPMEATYQWLEELRRAADDAEREMENATDEEREVAVQILARATARLWQYERRLRKVIESTGTRLPLRAGATCKPSVDPDRESARGARRRAR